MRNELTSTIKVACERNNGYKSDYDLKDYLIVNKSGKCNIIKALSMEHAKNIAKFEYGNDRIDDERCMLLNYHRNYRRFSRNLQIHKSLDIKLKSESKLKDYYKLEMNFGYKKDVTVLMTRNKELKTMSHYEMSIYAYKGVDLSEVIIQIENYTNSKVKLDFDLSEYEGEFNNKSSYNDEIKECNVF